MRGLKLAQPGKSGVDLLTAPLDDNLMPAPTETPKFKLAPVGASGVETLGFTPVSKTADVSKFTPEEASQRDIYRDYGVNIRPGVNLEGTAGQLQSTGSKWGNGLVKMVGTAATTFLEPFVQIGYGLPKFALGAIAGDPNFADVYDNPITQTFDEFGEYMRKEYPNFYTQAEKDMGFAQSLGTSNFWSDQGLQGVGFLAGAIASGYAAGASNLVGSTYRSVGMGKVRAWRGVVNKFRKSNLGSKASQINKTRDIIGSINTNALNANMYGAGLFSALGEAGIEARESKRRAVEIMTELRATGDPRYAGMSDEEMDTLSDTAANTAYGLNALIVGGSNVLQFGKAFSRGWNPTSKKYLRGLISKDTAKKDALKFSFKELPKGWQRAAQTASWFKNPSVEAFEEWSQASINVAVEDYFKDVYSSEPWSDTSDYIEGGMGVMSALAKGYVKSPQTKEGQQAIFLGALLGKLGEAGSALKKDGTTSRQDWLKTYERTKGLATKLNGLDPRGTLSKLLQAHAEIQKSQEKMDEALKNNDVVSYENAEASALFSLIDTYIEAERIEDFEAFVDDIGELSNEEFKEAMGIPQDIEVKDVSELVKDIKNKIEVIKDQKPKIDKFLMSASRMDDLEKFRLGAGLRFYGYMSDHLDSRREKLSREISNLSNGNINYETLKGLPVDSLELKAALAEMMDNANKDTSVNPLNLNSLPDAFEAIGKVEFARQAYIKKMNEILNGELEPATITKILKKAEKTKTAEETKAEEIKAEILEEEDAALSEDKENTIALETTEVVEIAEEPKTLAEEVKETMTISEKEQADIQKEITRSTKGKIDALLKSLNIPTSDDVTTLLEQQDAEINRLVELEERGVDIEATEETPVGALLSYPNASINARFMGQEGIVYKDTETGETVFESQSGQQFVLGQNVNESTLADLGIEALQDQTYISIVADGRTFEIGGQFYNNLYINPLSAIDPFIFRQDAPGYVPTKVTLFDSEGNKVTFVNPFIVQELSRLIALMEVVKKEAEIELLDLEGDQVFEFEGKKYYIEETTEQPFEVDGRYTTASERRAGVPTTIVYNENLNKLRSPSKIAQVIKARDAHIEKYIQEKINKFKEEYNEDILGKRTDGDVTTRTEEEVKQDAAESTGEPVSAESIGTEQTAPDKTNKQAESKPKSEEVERGAEVSLSENTESEESPFYENTVSESNTDVAPVIIASETALDDDTAGARQVIVKASDLDMEVPDNDNVDISNEDTNKKDSDIIDDIQPLKSILSLAWKSLNHPYQSGEDNPFNTRLTNLLEGDPTTEFGKLKENGTLKGVDVIFTIDLKDPQLTKVEAMQAIASKVRHKKALSPTELGNLPIKAVLQVPNADSKTGVSQFQTYVHIADYIDSHIKLEEQEAAKEMLAELRSTIYNNYLNGIESKTYVSEMTGGHLNNVNRNAKNNLTAFLNVGKKGNPTVPMFVFARNGNYVNEFGEVDKDFKFLSVKSKTDENGKVVSNNDGAVYIKVPMNNGEMFPLRVFTNELNKDLSLLVWNLVNGMFKKDNPNFNDEISEFERLKDPANDEIYRDLAGVLDTMLESKNPTYNQVLDLLIYKGKKTINSKAPTFHYSNGKLTLGEKSYTAKEWTTSKQEIVSYLMANKRTHVNAKYMNSKTQNAYNLFLAKHNLVYTNAFTNSSTRSPFVQPTIRFAPIGAKKEERAPLPGPSPIVKPEAPAAKKEPTKPDQPKGFRPEGVTTPFDLSSKGEVAIQKLFNSAVSFLRTSEKSLEVMFKDPETFKYLVEGRIIKNDGRELYDTALQGLNSDSTIKFHRNLREHKEILDNTEVGINRKFKADEEVVKLKDLLVEYPFLVPALNYVLKTMDTRWKASSEKEFTKPAKATPRVEKTSPAPGPGGMKSLTMADLPADMQEEAAAALAAFEAGSVTDLNKDKELVEAGLGAIVPTSSKVANILKAGTVVTGKELESLLEETSKQGKVELNLEQEDGTAPSDNSLDWGTDAKWMLDITQGMNLDDNLDITKDNLDCE